MFRVGFSLRVAQLLAGVALLVGSSTTVDAQVPPPAVPAAPTPSASPPLPVPAPGPPAAPAAPPKSDPPPAAPVADAQLTSVLRGSGGVVALVGRSGQLYEPAGDFRWMRLGAGGVSTSVQSMYRSGTGKLYAVGDHAPLFARQDGLWAAYPLARAGRSAASSGAQPIIALRRQIYELGANGWRSIAQAPAIVEHLWASSPSRIYLSDRDDQLWARRGGGWQRIQITLAAGEHIARIDGLPGKFAVALTSSGRLFTLDNRVARVLSTAAVGPAVHVQTLGTAEGKLLAAAQNGATSVLLEVGPKNISQVEELWPLVDGDRFAVIASLPTGLLVATSLGQARVRLPNQTWRNAQVGSQPPIRPPGLPKSGPARAR